MLLSPPLSRAPLPAADAHTEPACEQPSSTLPSAPFRLPPLSWAARRFLLLLTLLFLTAVACNLNGSSTGYFRSAGLGDIRVRDARLGLLAGLPKHIRGDEWYVWTPAILSQARQLPQPFPVSNPSLGPGVTPLLMSIPARHYTMFLRPQLWGYFLLPVDYAFSWNWNAKVFGLFAAMFALFWTLTDGRFGLSVFGAVAIQFSGFVQWWFSTPAMLPEMLACWAVWTLAAATFFTPRSWRWQALSAGVFVMSLAGFFLCCYPAFLIPLLHLGIAIVLGYLWQKRLWSWRGAGWLAGALVLTGLALAPWVRDCLPTLRIEADTVYPGHRHIYGGHLPLARYFSGLFTLGMTERAVPGADEMPNVCEASNFYPLWLVPLALGAWACVARMWRGETAWRDWLADRGIKIALAAYLCLMTLYAFVALPPWFCDLTLLSRETEGRALLGLGVAGTILLVLALATRPAGWRRPTRPTVLAATAWILGVATFLAVYAAVFVDFLTPWRLAGVAAAAIVGVLAYGFAPRWLLPAVWSVAFVAYLALVNPVSEGLPEMLESPVMNHLRAIVRADPQARWAVYDSLPGVELIKTTGAQVVNGARIIPDFSIIDRLDPAHRHLDKYNQYSHLYFTDAPYQAEPPVSIFSVVYCRVGLHPRRLRELFPEVKYVVAAREQPPDFAEAGFQLIGSVPENNLWLYAKTR